MQLALRQKFTLNVSRYWELDAVRGMAIILMVFYHLTWDLDFFGVVQLNMISGPWNWFAHGIATMFISVMGASLVVSYHRLNQRQVVGQTIFFKYLRRGGKIFGWGLLITVATYLFLDFRGGRGFVIFGILHVIGFSIMAAYPFLPYRRRWLSLIIGLMLIGMGVYFEQLISSAPWLIPLGIKQTNRLMVDYYPILPWYGVALLGIYLGSWLYPNGEARFNLAGGFNVPPLRVLTFLGQHSLLIYLIHQPILLGLLIILGIGAI